jgi:O-antigen/teichoic acid export membrane protein
MTRSRTGNTIRNIFSGLVNRGVSILLPFLNRTAILWILGAEFTGLTGLFSSILNVLNIAELGFNTAVVYSLYQLFENRDEQKICELVTLLRKIYRIVGTVVLVLGLAVMPFLPVFMNGTCPEGINPYILYLLYLGNSVLSYFLFAYKECLLIADQRQDIANNIRTVVSIARYMVQLIILVATANFYLYLIVAVFGTICTNIAIQMATRKQYPDYHTLDVSIKMPEDLKQQVKGLLIGRICDISRNSFDSIIISSFLGLTATAIYGNYYYIYSALYGIMLVICNAMGASVGNSIIEKTKDENYKDFLTFSALFAWIAGWCTVCLSCLYQPFMEVWAGKELLLPDREMYLFCIYFYVINMNNVRNQYISGNGMWWKLRRSYIAEAGANLLLNIVLGKLFGITGVLLASIATIFLFNYLQRNDILFRNYFSGENMGRFMLGQFAYGMLTVLAVVITSFCCARVPSGPVGTILYRSMICIVVPNIIFALGYFISPDRNNILELLKKIRSATRRSV